MWIFSCTRGLVPEPHIVQRLEGHDEVLDILCCHGVTNQNRDTGERWRGRGAPGALILPAGTQTVWPLWGRLWLLLRAGGTGPLRTPSAFL